MRNLYSHRESIHCLRSCVRQTQCRHYKQTTEISAIPSLISVGSNYATTYIHDIHTRYSPILHRILCGAYYIEGLSVSLLPSLPKFMEMPQNSWEFTLIGSLSKILAFDVFVKGYHQHYVSILHNKCMYV